jgi:hypothetical protein
MTRADGELSLKLHADSGEILERIASALISG